MSSSRLSQWVPITRWLPHYDRSWFTADVVAGLTVWGFLVPEGIAYSGLAGLPAQAGLYTILVTLLAYAVFGTSRQLVVGATSATAALVGGTVAALRPQDAAQYAKYAAALVLMVGALFLLAGVARLGFVAQFLSQPVMEGFVFGLALFVGVGQLHKLFGVEKGSGNVLAKFWDVLTQLGDANWWDFLVSALALALLFGLPRLSRKIPAGLIVLAVAIGLSTLLDLHDGHGIEIVGKLPKGLPSIARPEIGLGALWVLLPGAAGIVLVAYSEALGVAQTLAQRHGYEIDPNQELRAHGMASIASGFLGGLVGAGGMSGSAVADGAGARSQLSSIVTTVMALITVVALTPLFTNLPEAVLGALVLHAVSHMMKWRKLRDVYRLSRSEFWLAIVAVMGVVLIDVLQGLLIAVVASLLMVVYRSSRPAVVVLGESPRRPGVFVTVTRHPDAVPVPEMLIVRLDAPMYYANAVPNRDAVKDLVRRSPGIRTVVIDVEVQHELDVTSIESLVQLLDWARADGIELYLVDLHAGFRLRLDETGLTERFGEDHLLPTVADAVAATRSA